MEYELPKEIKWTFILNVLLFITGLLLDKDVVIGASVIISVILSVGIQILEAIYSVGNKSN